MRTELADIAVQLVAEGMDPDTANRFLKPIDANGDVPAFVTAFWAQRNTPVKPELLVPALDADEVADAAGYAWPDEDSTIAAAALKTSTGSEVYLEDLVLWLGEQKWSGFCMSLANQYRLRSYLSDKQVTAALSVLSKSAAKRSVDPAALVATTLEDISAPAFVIEPGKVTSAPRYSGVYSLEGEFYRVRWNRDKDHLFAEHIEWDSFTNKITFEYEPGVVSMIDGSNQITEKTAKEFGNLTGHCIWCGKMINSDVGYNPACAIVHGWHHPRSALASDERIREMRDLQVGDDPSETPTLTPDDGTTEWFIDFTTDRLIQVIKVVRTHTGISLKEAKDMVDARRLGPFTTRLADEILADLIPCTTSLHAARI